MSGRRGRHGRMKRRKFEDESESEVLSRVDSLNDFIVQDEERDERNERGDEREEYENEKYDDFRSPFPITKSVLELPTKEKEEYLTLTEELASERPTIKKIMSSNITKMEKKQCLRLFEQLNCVEDTNAEYYRLIDSINDILSKGKLYTKAEIQFLEKEENKLKNMYMSNDTLKTKILKLEADDKIKSTILRMYEEMLTYPTDSSTYSSLREEIEWSIRLPYQKREVDPWVNMNNVELNRFYVEVRKMLDEHLYGMNKVKERILHVLNDRRSSGDGCGRNIALVASPGCGKSEVCKVLAKILNKKFAKISAATLDSAAIKGSNKVYIGSEPSMVLQILAELKTNNALLLIDEVDKVDKKCQHALLHLSDTADNKDFQDNYLKNFSHDLSKVMFIFTMNSIDGLDPALLDRLDIIQMDEYTNDDKLQIFKNYMLPKALVNVGMKKGDVVVMDNAIKKLLEDKNVGLRGIEKIIKDIVGKVNMYKNVCISGGLGDLQLSYKIPNFKLPLKIDQKLLYELV